MAKRKYPSELNSRTVRVNIGDWKWLNSLAQALGTTVAEAFHKVVTEQAHKAKTPTPEPAQIPMMPVFFEPKSIESNGIGSFKPASISTDKVTMIKLKSIK